MLIKAYDQKQSISYVIFNEGFHCLCLFSMVMIGRLHVKLWKAHIGITFLPSICPYVCLFVWNIPVLRHNWLNIIKSLHRLSDRSILLAFLELSDSVKFEWSPSLTRVLNASGVRITQLLACMLSTFIDRVLTVDGARRFDWVYGIIGDAKPVGDSGRLLHNDRFTSVIDTWPIVLSLTDGRHIFAMEKDTNFTFLLRKKCSRNRLRPRMCDPFTVAVDAASQS